MASIMERLNKMREDARGSESAAPASAQDDILRRLDEMRRDARGTGVPQRTDNHGVLHQIEQETGRNATAERLAPIQKPQTILGAIRELPKLIGEGIQAKAKVEADMATDDIIDPLEAAGLGLAKGMGALSAGEAIGAGIGKITGNEDIQKRAREVSDINDQMLKEAKEQNSLAFGAGNIGGNLMLMSGIGQGLGAIKGLGQLPTIARGAIKGLGTLAGAEAIHGAGAAATGKITPGEYAKNVAVSGIAGAAGGALSAGVNAAGLKLLRGMNKAKDGVITAGSDFIGAQNKVLPNVLLGGASSLGYSAGVTGTQELSKAITDEDYTPDWNQIGTSALTAFAFGAINAYLRTAQTSEANRSTMQQVNDAVQDSYRKWSEATDPAIKAQYAEETAAWADRAIKSLADMQIVGADQQVRDMADFLWNIEQEMAAYTTLNTNFGAELGTGGALVPGMAGGLAPTGGQPAPETPRGALPDQTGALAALAVNGNVPAKAPKAQPEGLTLPTLEPENAQNAKKLPAAEGKMPTQAAIMSEGTGNMPTERYSLRDVPVPTYEELVAKPDVTVVDVRRPQTGNFAEERAAFLDSPAAKQMYSAPVVNRDTGEGIFITPATMTHTFSNEGWEQIELAEHLPEIVETAVLTHAEPSRKAPDDRTTGIYTLFGAAETENGIQPVKLTVKEYNIEKQAIPATIAKYLGDGLQPETYASVYDGKVLVLEGIEKESPSSSAATDATAKAAVYHPSGLSEISVKDLLALVKGDALKYVPKPTAPAAPIIKNGGMMNGNEGNAGPQLAGPRGNEAGQNAVGETGALYRGDAGGRPDELGRGAADAIRIRGGSKENRALTIQRQQAAMKQPLASPADFGIENGSANPTLRELPEADYDAEATEFVEWAYKRGVKDVKIVTGLIQIETPEGPVSVLDVINKDTGTLIIRGDSLKRSLSETGRHSVGHFVTGQTQVESFERAIKGRYKEEAWGHLFDTYRRSWAPLTNNYEGMTERETELYVWEEILEDAYAGVDNYGTKASEYSREALAVIDGTQETGELTLPTLDNAPAGTQPEINGIRGPPARYLYAGKNARSADSEALAEAERLKSAEPVTADADGKDIPLPERLGKKPDIRYSVDSEEPQEYNALMERDDVLLGEQDDTFTEANRTVPFTYAIVPGDSLIISNDEYGNVNPQYPQELQPRDRTRTASQEWTADTSKKLNPRKLAESATAQNGAPIVRGDGVVIGGNGRSRSILMAYANGNAGEYEQFLREKGSRYGIDTANLPDKPILVRIAQDVDDWTALAEELNVSSQAAYSATERAMSDARKMEGVLELLVPNDDGDINTAANAAFIQAFIQKVVPKNEQGDVLDGPGHLSQKGLERVENAIFAYAYGDPNLLQKYSESLDNDMKNVTNALMQSAPAAVALQADIKAGRAYDLPAVQTILKAMEIFTEAKRDKKTVEEQANQLSLLEPENQDAGELAMFIDRNKRSAKQMRIAFNSLYEEIESYGDPNQESFFGGEEHDIHGALEGAVKRYEQATGREFGRPDYWGAGMDAGMGSEAAAPGAGTGSEPNDESVGRSGEADAGADGGGVPESEPGELTLPTLEEEPKPAKAPKASKEPKPRKERAPARRKPPEPIPSTLPESGIPEGYNSIEEFVASSTARAEAAKAERLRNVSKDDFVGTPALQKIGVKIDNSVGIYSRLRWLIDNDRAAKQIQRETHRAERRLGATDAERNFASGIVAGVYNASDIPASMNRDKVMELADYYWAEQAVADDSIRMQREQIGRALEEKMEELFKDSDEFKPSKAIVLNYRTPQRNMLHIFGDERGKAINEALFDPVAVNEAERFRFVNRMHDEVRTFAGEDGKQRELTKEERALVQMLIEGKAVAEEVASMEMRSAIENVAHNIRNGADAGDSAKEFGLSREESKLALRYAQWLETDEALHSGKVDAVKVENAAKKYSELFDQFYDAINDFLVAHGYEPIGFIKGYAPHIQPENNQNLLNKALNTLGINTDVTRLPSSIAGLTANYKPNKRWNPYFLSRTSDVTDYDIASAFESYVDYMSDVLYHTDDIMRIRQAAKYFRQTYAPEEIKNNLSWANELRYGTAEQKANYLRDQGVIDRSAVLSPADINAQMDEYVEKLFGDITKTTKYSDLVMWLDNYANILAGKQSAADRAPESMWGREVLNIGNKLVRTFAQANVAGNLSSMLNQTAQIPMIQAELGSRWTAAAIKDILTGKLRRAEWASQSDFLTGKKGIEYLVSTPGEMVLTALFKPAEIMDTFVSTVAVRGKYLKELHAGKSPKEAMKAADAFGTAVMGSRMKGSKPLAFNSKNPIYQMVNIFQIEALNSWEHIKEDLPRDFRTIEKEQGKGKAALALAGVIVKALLLTFLMNRLAEKTYGGTPAPFDLLGMTANFIASGNGLTTNAYLETLIDNAWEKISGERLFGTEDHIGEEPFDYETALEDLGYNVSNDIPFLRNAAGLLGLGDQTLPMPDIIGNALNIGKGIYNNGLTLDTGRGALKMLSELIPGGKQLYKTALGLETIMRGGDFSGKIDNEKLKYPTEDDFWSTVQSLMFGKYATEASDEYYASGASELSANQTRLWRSLTEGGADPGETYDAIQSYRKIANDEDLTSYEKGVQERALIRDLDMTDDQKLEMYRELSDADSRAEKFRAIMDTGLSFAQTISAYDKYAEIDADEGKKATEKATAFSKWIDQQGYKSSQAKAIKEELKFWNIIPADATRYEKLTDAGLETEDAFKLTNALADLKPEPGKENVSDMQKYRVIDSSDLSDREKIAAVGTIMGTDMTTESGNPSQYAKMLELLDDGVTLDQYLDLSEADAVDGYLRYEGVNVGRDYGITPETYLDYKERLPSFDADKNGSYKQEEIEAALDSMGGGPTLPSLGGKRDATLTNTQRAVLWQLANKSWKPKNNPYDTTVGQWVYDALHAEPEENSFPILRGEAGDLPKLNLQGSKE